MTLHSAKGLEADNLIVVGVADQILPGPSEDSLEREEQRRLLYVAVTRARDTLVLSWPQQCTYREARGNYIRRDKGATFQASNQLLVSLKKSTFLPRHLPTLPGSQWLAD